jgi:hypothetical protein
MGDEAYWTRLKPLLYTYYLRSNIKTALVNSTQNLILGWPVLAKHTRWSLARMMSAMARVATGTISEREKGFLEDLEAQGYLDPKMSDEIASRGGNAIYRSLATSLGKAYSFLDLNRAIERFNRQAMAVALFDAGIRDVAEAGEFIEEAHFPYGKGNRPTLARGYGSAAFTFRTFTINQLTWIKNEIKAGRKPPLARHIAAWMLIGGANALPFVVLGKLLYTKIFQRDPEQDAAEVVGDLAAQILFRGAPSLVGVSLTGSVGMQDITPTFEPGQDIAPAIGEWILGVAADIPARVARVSQDLTNRQWARALEDASPEAIKNPLAAWRLHQQGATTRNGRTIIDWNSAEQMRLDDQEAALKALGFAPDKIARQYDKERILKRVGGQTQITKQHWADRLHLARLQKDAESAQGIFLEIAGYNQKMKERRREDLIVKLDDVIRMTLERQKAVNLPARNLLPTFWKLWPKEEVETAAVRQP